MTGWIVVHLTLLGAPTADADGTEFFEKKIRPVLVRECYGCHSADAKEVKGSFRLDSRAAMRQGGATAPAVVPGDVSASLLIAALRREDLEMPPGKTLPASVVADFVRWIQIGAPDPRVDTPPSVALGERHDWWSLRPVAQVAVPDIAEPSRSTDVIDRFVLSRLEEAALHPAPAADRHALLRRVSFVLRGLPPTPEEIDAFLADASPDRYARVVDRFLASPSFGERWARHWMDVIAYAETQGHEWNPEVRGAWRYRDYLIRAFNEDVPYDQLIREHLAGDLLAEPRWEPVDEINESLAATAFLRFGEVDHDDCRLFPDNYLDPIEHQIDTISKGFQATTLACARCHDHKFDAVSMRDYYALSGILSNARHVVHTLDRPELHRQRKLQLATLKGEMRDELVTLWEKELDDQERYVLAALAQAIGDADATSLAKGLDTDRLEAWSLWMSPPTPEGKKKKPQEKQPDDPELFALGSIDGPLRRVAFVLAEERARVTANANVEAACAARIKELWQGLASRYERESTERRAFNEENFTVYEDFRTEAGTTWTKSGLALTDRPSPSGQWVVAPTGERVVAQILQAGIHSHTLSNRLNASLRSPLIPKARQYVSMEVAGDGGAVRQVYENCSVWNGGSVRLRSNKFRWVRVNTLAEKPDVRLVLGLATRFDDYGYPGIFAKTFSDPENIRSHFSVRQAVLHDCKESPREEFPYMEALLADRIPSSRSDVARLYSNAFRDAVHAWSRGEASDADALWLDVAADAELLANSVDASPRLQDLTRRYRELEGSIRPPRVIAGVTDFEHGFDVRLRLAGEAHRPGELVPRGYLQVLADDSIDRGTRKSQSGRLELAAKIARPENPLTARVMVNRIWHHVFGAGLVGTPDDFGRLGELPTHPELLDYLTHRFVASGWSVKSLVRDLLLTRSFRMSSRVDTHARESDPENSRLHHYPLRRLEGEAIRDSMLAVSGRLDRALYGPSIDPYRTEERPVRKLLCGPVDGNGRRSVYTRFTLTEEPPFLATFNLPDPKHPRGRRDVTNVPTQALTLLNNPFVLDQAALWARRVMKTDGDTTTSQRLGRMFHEALGRPPTADELDRFVAGAHRFAQIHGISETGVLKSEAVWKDLAHLLFNVKEFIYLP